MFCFVTLRVLHPFPTRRSSDLANRVLRLLAVLHLVGQRHPPAERGAHRAALIDRKSTRLNSSHVSTSYAVFRLKKKSRRIVPCRWHVGQVDVKITKPRALETCP